MKRYKTLLRYCMVVAILIAGNVQASDSSLLDNYFTLVYPGDSITLKANETALVVGTAFISLNTPAWTTIEYKRGTNDFVTLTLELSVSANNLPLSGPGVVRLGTNWDYSFTGPGLVGLKIVHSARSNVRR